MIARPLATSRTLRALAPVVFLATLLCVVAAPASAQTCFVEATGDNTTDYSGNGSDALQAAVNAASSGATLKIAGTCTGVQTVAGRSQTVSVGKALTLVGGYAAGNWGVAPDPVANPTVLDAGGAGRVAFVTPSGDLTLQNLVLQNGSSSFGGAIWHEGPLVLDNCLVQGNSAVAGGGIWVQGGSLTVRRSSFVGNTATTNSGGAINNSGLPMVIEHATFSGNSAAVEGGAITGADAPMSIRFSTFSDNSAPSGGGLTATADFTLYANIIANSTGGGDCAEIGAGPVDGGYNLIEDGGCLGAPTSLSGDPALDVLAANGGVGPTHALQQTSPARDAIPTNVNGCGVDGATDQRGVLRGQDAGCDLGAIETYAPVATDDAYTVVEDGMVSGNVVTDNTGNGVDSDIDSSPLTVSLGSNVSHGTLSLTSNGAFTYTPDPDFNGTDSFSYVLSDGDLTDTATVTLTVTPVNDPPVATDDAYTVDEDGTLTGNVVTDDTGNGVDSDVDSSPLTVSLGSNVSHGTLSLGSNGSFTYTPDPDFNGTDSFSYVLSDGDLTDTATVTLTVTPVNDPPVATDDAYTVDEDGTLTGNVVTDDTGNGVDSDIDSSPLTVSLGSNVSHGTLSLASNGAFTYTPDPEFSGADSFGYVLSDGALTDTATVTLTVTPVNDPPVATDNAYGVVADGTRSGNVVTDDTGNGVDSDVDSSPLTVSLGSNVSHGTLSLGSNGSFTYTPNPAYTGTDSFTYVLSDGQLTDSAQVTLTVAPAMELTGSDPVHQALNVDPSQSIILSFDANVDPATISPQTLGLHRSMGRTAWDFDVNGGTLTLLHGTFFAGEVVRLSISDGLRSAAGGPAVPNQIQFTAATTAPQACAPQFTDIGAGLTGVQGGDVAWGDADGDGDLDILVTGSTGGVGRITQIYLNDGGTFADIGAGLPGSEHGAVAWGDYDNDGDLDFLLARRTNARIYRNDGGTFTDISAGLPEFLESDGAWGDYDNDGDLDLVISGAVVLPGFPFEPIELDGRTHLYRNDGGVFTLTAVNLQKAYGGSVEWGDYDNDGDLDLLLTGKVATANSNRVGAVYRNDGGSFTRRNVIEAVQAGDARWGDYDGDGDLDIVLVGLSSQGLKGLVYRNDSGNFVQVDIGLIPVSGSAVAWGDADGDGDLDILAAGNSSTLRRSRVYLNDNGAFRQTQAGLTDVSGAAVAWGDYDGDGDLDILLSGWTGSIRITRVYRNDPGCALTDDSYAAVQDLTFRVDAAAGVTSNDQSGPYTVALDTPPTHGTVDLAADGGFDYTPTPGFMGADAFSYTLVGWPGVPAATVTIEVGPLTGLALDDAYAAIEDTPLTVAAPGAAANDAAYPVTLTVDLDPTHGTLTLATDGGFVYTPAPSFNGVDGFTYRATLVDDPGVTDTAVVTLTVAPVNDAPVAVDDAYETIQGSPLAVAAPGLLANDSDGDEGTETLTASLDSGPLHGTLALDPDGGFVYTPDPSYTGADSFTYLLRDGAASAAAYWPFEEGAGTTTADLGGSGLGGTLSGPVFTATVPGATTFANAYALSFDGNDVVAIPDSNLINTAAHDQRAVALWFRADDVGLASRKQILWEEGGTANGLNLYLFDGSLYAGAWSDTNGWSGTWLTTAAVVSDTWHHVVLTLDSSSTSGPTADSLHLYLDGALVDSGGAAQLAFHSSDNGIGDRREDTRFHDGDASGNGGHGFAGLIDDVRIVNGPMSAADVVRTRTEQPGLEDTAEVTLTVQAALRTVTVVLTGNGSGTVTSDPAGIDCGTDCSEAFPEGTVVTLTATPDTGSAVGSGWLCAGDSCTVTITGDLTVFGDFGLTGVDTHIVDGVACTLGDAIEAANRDATVGGCIDERIGSDVIELAVDAVLNTADAVRSTQIGGAYAGLPDVTSAIVLRAGTAGSRIERDPSFVCDVADPVNEFRLLQVTDGGALTLEGLILANGCADQGGAVLVDGNGVLAIVNSAFVGNSARSGGFIAQGGALWAAATATTSIDGALFQSNVASGPRAEGGALWDGGALGTLSDSRFADNEVRSTELGADGGAAYVDGDPTITGVIFERNLARAADRSGASGGNSNGGALFLDGDGATISDSLFSQNVARGGDGDVRGGIAQGGALSTDNEGAGSSLVRVSFAGNRAEGGVGGAVGGGDANGGAVYAYGVTQINTVTFSGNTARGGDSVDGAGAIGAGGALFVDTVDLPLAIEHTTFAANEAVAGSGAGGDGSAEGGGISANDDVTVYGSLFEGNIATVGGTSTSSACFDPGFSGPSPYLSSLGFNVLSDQAGACAFDAGTDLLDAGPSLLPLGEYGCSTALPDGSCLPTHPVAIGSPAHEAGSCSASGVTADARGYSRPWDDPDVANVDDGCDAGAYESRDLNNDEIDDDYQSVGLDQSSTDLMPTDPNPSVAGEAVTVHVVVTGSTIQPADGEIVITASTGETCSSGTPSAGTGLTVEFSCDLAFLSAGARELVAHFGQSTTHRFSTSATEPHSVVVAVSLSPESLPGGSVDAPYAQTISAGGTGSQPPFHYTVSAGSLPPGLSLSSASGELSGTPISAGPFAFDISANDSSGAAVGGPFSATRSYSISIAQASQSIDFPPLPDRLDNEGPFTVVATGGNSGQPVTFAAQTPSVCATSGSNGSTVTLSGQTGTCTVRASQAGSANYLPAPDVDRSFSVLASNTPPAISVQSSVAILEDSPSPAIAVQLSDAQSDPAMLLLTASSSNQSLVSDLALAAGLGGSGSDRSLVITPEPDANGSAIVTLTVSDPGGLSADATLQLQVQAVNDAPTLQLGADPTLPAGSSGPQTAAGFAGIDAGPPDEEVSQTALAYVLDSLSDPDGILQAGSLGIDAPSGDLRYTLTGTGGTASVQVRVRDSGGVANGGEDTSAPLTLSITVEPSADLQIAKASAAVAQTGDPVVFTLTVANAGPNDVVGASLADPMPSDLLSPLWACLPAASSAPCPTPGSGSGDLAVSVDLPVGTHLRFDVSGLVGSSVGTQLSNTATITAPAGIVDLQPANNQATASILIVPEGIFANGFEATQQPLSVPAAAKAQADGMER